MSEQNTRILLKSRPVGDVGLEHFEWVTTAKPRAGEDEMLIRNIYLSVDPYMRPRMNEGKSYFRPFQIGEVLEGVIRNMNEKGRVALCGVISNYNLPTQEANDGPDSCGLSVGGLFMLISRQIKMQGFLVSAYPDLCREYGLKARGWLAEGKLKSRVSIAHGIENAPSAFLGLFTGENTGKQLVALSSEEIRSGI